MPNMDAGRRSPRAEAGEEAFTCERRGEPMKSEAGEYGERERERERDSGKGGRGDEMG